MDALEGLVCDGEREQYRDRAKMFVVGILPHILDQPFSSFSYRIRLPPSLDLRLVFSIALTFAVADAQLREPDTLALVS
jgi:hypothetical protein